MSTPRYWTPERKAQLRALAAEGKTVRQAAAVIGCSDCSAMNAASSSGISFNGKDTASWPAHVIERLRGLVEQGLSARKIAAQIGLSKNAVLGKIHRLGLEMKTKPGWPSAVLARDEIPRPRNSSEKRPRKQRIAPTTKPELLFGVPVTLLNLTYAQCRYPVAGEGADTLFCGVDKQEVGSYCAHHAWRCYRRASESEAGAKPTARAA